MLFPPDEDCFDADDDGVDFEGVEDLIPEPGVFDGVSGCREDDALFDADAAVVVVL